MNTFQLEKELIKYFDCKNRKTLHEYLSKRDKEILNMTFYFFNKNIDSDEKYTRALLQSQYDYLITPILDKNKLTKALKKIEKDLCVGDFKMLLNELNKYIKGYYD